MSDSSGESGEDQSSQDFEDGEGEVIPPSPKNENGAKPRTEVVLQSLVEVERRRIESADKRTEVMRLFVQSNDEADKRQYQYQMARLDSDDKASVRRHNFSVQLVWVLIAVGTIVIAALLSAALFGSDRQSAIAETTLKYLLAGLGGYGVVKTGSSFLKRFFTSPDTDND